MYYLFFHCYHRGDGVQNKIQIQSEFSHCHTSMSSNYSKYSYIMKMNGSRTNLFEKEILSSTAKVFRSKQ